jgi:F420-non-reducing hydrogenase small subunit
MRSSYRMGGTPAPGTGLPLECPAAHLMEEVRVASKPKLAIYWSASCGGCEIAVVNLNERILDVAQHFDLVFCPCLVDTKKHEIEALEDGAIDVTLFNGAIRTDENEEMAHVLRRTSKVLVAMGACASTGGIPAMANLHTREQILAAAYLDSPTTKNPDRVLPQVTTQVAEGELSLPALHGRVRALHQVVPVDYTLPGCPPETEQIWNVLSLLLSGAPLPAKGSVVGACDSSVCDQCSRQRTDKKIGGFRRIHEFVPDREICLLEQGLVCMGVATRGGCGGLCPEVNMPCIGCYGPPEGVYDQGAKLAATLGSILDIAPIRELRDEAEINQVVDRTVAGFADPAGTACKFSMAARTPRTAAAGKDARREAA